MATRADLVRDRGLAEHLQRTILTCLEFGWGVGTLSSVKLGRYWETLVLFQGSC